MQPRVGVPALLPIHGIPRHLDTAGVLLTDLGLAKLLKSDVAQQRTKLHDLCPQGRGGLGRLPRTRPRSS
eukprot:450365-Rhodomonas_salina.3